MVTPRLAAALASVLLVAGCGGGARTGPAPEEGTATGAASGTPAVEGSASAEPDVPFPGVEPARGPRVRQPSIELRAPTTWTRGQSMATNQSGADGPGIESLSLMEMPAWGGDLPLDEDAKIALRNSAGFGDLERMPDVDVRGQPMYRIGGPGRRDTWYEKVGTVRAGRLISIVFHLERSGSYGDDPHLVESVLNTVRWR